MVRVTAIRAVNFPVENEDECLEFYGEQLGMNVRPGALPGGTMCRWDPESGQFVGLRRIGQRRGRRWRYPYGRLEDWDHVELSLDGNPNDVSPVETHSDALVFADPEERAIEAFLEGGGSVEVPGIFEVGLSVVDVDRTRAFYERLGFGSGRWDADGRFVFHTACGQRWVLVESDSPGLRHVGFGLDPDRFRAVKAGHPVTDSREEGERFRVNDPEGRELFIERTEPQPR